MCDSAPGKSRLKFDRAKRGPPEAENISIPKERPQQQQQPETKSAPSSSVTQQPKEQVIPLDPPGSKLRRQNVPEAKETGKDTLTRRRKGEKKVSKAAAAQQSMTFQDAWTAQNQGRFDIWFWIGLVALITPFAILAWGIQSGAIPTGGAFD